MKNILASIRGIVPQATEIDWQVVYAHSLPRIFHYFCYRVGDTGIAEDLTATTFEKAWTSRSNFRQERGQAHAWLLGIAHNVVVEYFRKKPREIPFENVPEKNLTSSFDEDMQRRLDFQAIFAILTQFPERDRELIAMKYGAEMTNREIARLTGLSESNVGTILHRVVTKLRIKWEKDHHE